MPSNIEATPEFLSEAKKLTKKYPSFKSDIADLATLLSTNSKHDALHLSQPLKQSR